jgi:hypothetical protein
MTGENSLTAPTMYIEIIFHDTDLGINEAFVDGGSGTYYFAWKNPVKVWFDVFNSVDEGLLSGIGFFTDLAVSGLVTQLIDQFVNNERLRLAANVAKVPIQVYAESMAVAVGLAVYYKWIDFSKFLKNGGLSRLINAALNPISIGGTLISAASGLVDNTIINLLVGQGTQSISTWITTQSMLAVIDDTRLDCYA